MANITKEYTNGEITIVWKPNTCMHSEKCWRGLHDVFDPKARPWVNPEGASSEAIMKQIDQCPSGALSYYKNSEGKHTQKDLTDLTSLEVMPNGPVIVSGNVEITHSNGAVEKREKTTALCRCGFSANKPFCDGSHNSQNWKE